MSAADSFGRTLAPGLHMHAPTSEKRDVLRRCCDPIEILTLGLSTSPARSLIQSLIRADGHSINVRPLRRPFEGQGALRAAAAASD